MAWLCIGEFHMFVYKKAFTFLLIIEQIPNIASNYSEALLQIYIIIMMHSIFPPELSKSTL